MTITIRSGKYGPGVEIDIAEPEDAFAIFTNREDLTVNDIIMEFELERRDEYYNRATVLCRKALQRN